MINVLIVEDEIPILRGIKMMIEQSDPEFRVVKCCMNGQEAVKFLQEDTADILFTDINMPLMDGIELMKYVNDHFPDMIKIAISGYSEFTYAQQAIACQAVRYLLKPILRKDMEELLTELRCKLTLLKEHKEKEQLLDALYPSLKENLKDSSLLKSDLPDGQVRKIELYIREHLTEPISVKELSLRFGLSAPYLGKLFKEIIGYSPGQYIQMLRIEYAKGLLAVNDHLLAKDVAFMVGYTDSAYFSRLFKQKVGIWPSEYRASTIRASQTEERSDRQIPYCADHSHYSKGEQ